MSKKLSRSCLKQIDLQKKYFSEVDLDQMTTNIVRTYCNNYVKYFKISNSKCFKAYTMFLFEVLLIFIKRLEEFNCQFESHSTHGS